MRLAYPLERDQIEEKLGMLLGSTFTAFYGTDEHLVLFMGDGKCIVVEGGNFIISTKQMEGES